MTDKGTFNLYRFKNEKCLEEYGSVEKMDDTGVILNVNVEPFIQDIDDDVLDDRLENCALNRNEDYECLFKELVGDEYIERPKFRTIMTYPVDYSEFIDSPYTNKKKIPTAFNLEFQLPRA